MSTTSASNYLLTFKSQRRRRKRKWKLSTSKILSTPSIKPWSLSRNLKWQIIPNPALWNTRRSKILCPWKISKELNGMRIPTSLYRTTRFVWCLKTKLMEYRVLLTTTYAISKYLCSRCVMWQILNSSLRTQWKGEIMFQFQTSSFRIWMKR